MVRVEVEAELEVARSRLHRLEKMQNTIGENMESESKCPAFGRASQTHGGWDHVEPTLVAESVEPQDSPPEFFPVRSYG